MLLLTKSTDANGRFQESLTAKRRQQQEKLSEKATSAAKFHQDSSGKLVANDDGAVPTSTSSSGATTASGTWSAAGLSAVLYPHLNHFCLDPSLSPGFPILPS